MLSELYHQAVMCKTLLYTRISSFFKTFKYGKSFTVNTFMVFFVIFWGAIFNVQGRWKAFQFPFFGIFKKLTRRALFIVVLNVLPIIYFGIVPWIIKDFPKQNQIQDTIFLGVIPAFGIFGFYRLWLGILELSPKLYYYDSKIPDTKYRHSEPLLGNWFDQNKHLDKVYLGDRKQGC